MVTTWILMVYLKGGFYMPGPEFKTEADCERFRAKVIELNKGALAPFASESKLGKCVTIDRSLQLTK